MTDKTNDNPVVTLAVADYRLSSFDSGVKGVHPILNASAGGTAVPEKHVKAVNEAAEKRGVKLKKI